MSSPFEFTYISTFAGCGGSSLGYKWAGGRGLLAVEFDSNAAATYRANFTTPVLERDICTVTAEEVLKLTGLKVGELDVLDGSPPCQGFSTAGKRQVHDPRNSLFREFVRLIDGLQPKVFVMENVSGMVKGKMKYVFAEVMRCLKATGYDVRCQLLNAMYFNVPQSRGRLIWIGVRRDLGLRPQFPKAQGRPLSAQEAIADLIVNQSEREMLLQAGAKYVSFREWPRIRPGGCRTDLPGITSGFNCVKWRPDKPAQTVRKNDGHLSTHGAMHWAEQRRFTTAEFARFASFPDDFKWSGDYQNDVERIGNCVPPRLTQAIAECIRDTVLIPNAARKGQ